MNKHFWFIYGAFVFGFSLGLVFALNGTIAKLACVGAAFLSGFVMLILSET